LGSSGWWTSVKDGLIGSTVFEPWLEKSLARLYLPLELILDYQGPFTLGTGGLRQKIKSKENEKFCCFKLFLFGMPIEYAKFTDIFIS
jgi:hypothetical protein